MTESKLKSRHSEQRNYLLISLRFKKELNDKTLIIIDYCKVKHRYRKQVAEISVDVDYVNY